ncbi:MAG: T9SS type A sorting domain-containing protein [Bacteroidota bacterium]|nr:T9SS type A sorting domain-containing protein [Bacteroidota bacterium]
MKTRIVGIIAAVLMTAAAANAQITVIPGNLIVPANYSLSCGGTWTQVRTLSWGPVLPGNNPNTQYPPAGSPVSFVIMETDKSDIAPNQTDATLIVTAPNGWQFRANPTSGASVYVANDGDLTQLAVSVTPSTITISFKSNVNGNKRDALYVMGIDAVPTDGLIGSTPTRYAYRLTGTAGGTAVMNGIVSYNGTNPYNPNDSTNTSNATRFLELRLTTGSYSNGGYLKFTTQPSNVTACDDIVAVLQSVDCAGNPTTIDFPASVPVTFSAVPSPASTDLPMYGNIGTNYGNGTLTVTAHIRRNPGVYTLTAASSYPDALSDPFSVSACPPSDLVWTTDPNVIQGYAFLPLQPNPLVLQLQDEWGNPSYASGSVALTLEEWDYGTSGWVPSPVTVTINDAANHPQAIQPNANIVFSNVEVHADASYLGPFRFIPTITVSGVTTSASNEFTFSDPVPVQLVSFSGSLRNGAVTLTWKTATEADNYGFEVERALSEEGPWSNIGFREGNGTSNVPRSYEFIDPLRNLPPAEAVYYRLRQIDRSGAFAYSPTVRVNLSGLSESSRIEIVPTAIRGNGSIRLFLEEPSVVTLSVFDLSGREVYVIGRDISFETGSHSLPMNISGLQRGMYILRCVTGSNVLTSKFFSF